MIHKGLCADLGHSCHNVDWRHLQLCATFDQVMGDTVSEYLTSRRRGNQERNTDVCSRIHPRALGWHALQRPIPVLVVLKFTL